MIITPPDVAEESYSSAAEAYDAVMRLYQRNTEFLRDKLIAVGNGQAEANSRYRAFYPEVRISTSSFSHIDSRLSYGHVTAPGTYTATLTRPDLFKDYIERQLHLLIQNHGVQVVVAQSETPASRPAPPRRSPCRCAMSSIRRISTLQTT